MGIQNKDFLTSYFKGAYELLNFFKIFFYIRKYLYKNDRTELVHDIDRANKFLFAHLKFSLNQIKIMKFLKIVTSLIAFTAIFNSLNAQQTLNIIDLDFYADTASLQGDVFSFGSAAQAGKPTLSLGSGVGNTNAALYTLTWNTGNNANLGFLNLLSGSDDLSSYNKIETNVFLETTSGYATPTNATIIKLVIEGGSDKTIWQTRKTKAIQLTNGASNRLIFELSEVDMERVSAGEPLSDVLENVINIRLRFENTSQTGVKENAHIGSIVAIDSIAAITDPKESGTIIRISSINF